MRVALTVGLAVSLGACVPSAVGRPIDYAAVQRLRVGQSTPDDAVRELGPPYMRSATGPNEIMYGWTHWDYGARTSESVFLRFRQGRLVDLPGSSPATVDPNSAPSAHTTR